MFKFLYKALNFVGYTIISLLSLGLGGAIFAFSMGVIGFIPFVFLGYDSHRDIHMLFVLGGGVFGVVIAVAAFMDYGKKHYT